MRRSKGLPAGGGASSPPVRKLLEPQWRAAPLSLKPRPQQDLPARLHVERAEHLGREGAADIEPSAQPGRLLEYRFHELPMTLRDFRVGQRHFLLELGLE